MVCWITRASVEYGVTNRMPIRKISSAWTNTSEDTTPQAGLNLRSFSLKKTSQKKKRKIARISSPATILSPFYLFPIRPGTMEVGMLLRRFRSSARRLFTRHFGDFLVYRYLFG